MRERENKKKRAEARGGGGFVVIIRVWIGGGVCARRVGVIYVCR